MSAPKTPHWRGWRWIKRGTLGLFGFIVLAVAAALVVIHTDWGRGILRKQVEARLNAMFTGGATLGKLEGSPFSELTLHDLVLNGPDKQPAISVKTLRVAVGILPLLSHQARVLGVVAEDVDVDLKRNPDGTMQIGQLMVPGPKSTWSVALPRVELRRAHVKLDTGSEVMNLDNLAIDARVKMPYDGPIDASLEVTGNWRERTNVPLVVRTIVHKDETELVVPALFALAGELVVAGSDVSMVTVENKPPRLGGTIAANASVAAVQRLLPTLQLPADIIVAATARPVAGQPWTDLHVLAKVDDTPIKLTGQADLEAKHARGELVAGTLNLTKLSGGKLEGSAAASATFDVRPGGPKSLPIATAQIKGWGAVAGVPRTEFVIDVESAGERVKAVVDATGEGVKAKLKATVRTVGELLAIEDATLVASTSNPQAASGGKAPVRGSLQVNLAASGQIKPALTMAVSGTVDGRHLSMQDMSVAQLHVSLDASKLPNRPFGKAHVQIVDLVRGTMQLGAITLDATDRADGKVAVQVRSRPHQAPWLVDLDALVTPPAGAGAKTVVVDVLSHRVRAGNYADWSGKTGHIEIAPDRIVVRDLDSASKLGKLAIDGSFDRVRGDIDAKVDVSGVTLESIGGRYHGKLDAHIAVTRKRLQWDADVAIAGKGLQLDPSTVVIDTDTKIALHDRKLTLDVGANSLQLGTMKLAVALATPAVVTDAAAWKKLGREAIETGKLTMQGVDLRRAAELAGMEGEYAGRIDGDMQFTATTAGGRIEVKNVVAPQLRGITGVSAVLDLTQQSPTELQPTLTVSADGIGNVQAQAQLVVPEKMFDPVAWKQLGPAALKGATVSAEQITVDPGMLDRFGIISEMRAKVSFGVEVGEGARTFDAAVDVKGLTGAPIAQPLDIHLGAKVDDHETTLGLDVKTKGAALLALDGKVPLTIRAVLANKDNPDAIKQTPVNATLKLARTDAAKLLAVFGRSEITGGTLDGEVDLRGTIGAPTVKAKIVATGLKVPPGPRSKPVRTVDNLTITADWDGARAKLGINGAESDGGKLDVQAEVAPAKLADGSVTIKATKFDLVPLLAFLPGPAGGAAGTLDANLTVKGLDPKTMQLSGEVHLADGRVPIAPAVGTMRRTKLDAVIADHQIQLSVTGRLGGGDLTMKGAIALDGAAPNGGNAKITLREVAPIGSVEPKINADITARLSRDQQQWKADLVIDNALVVVPNNRGEALKPPGAPTDMQFANGKRVTRRPMDKEVPQNPVFVVDITLHSTRVESEEFRGLLKGKLSVRADGDAIGIVGGITADSGDLDLFGHRYYLDRAAVSFDGPIDPILDVRITHDFPDVTTITEVRGRMSNPELRMSSDPGSYSQGQLLGFLLGGDPGGDPQNSSATDKVAGAGASFVANQLGGYVKKALPIDIDVLRYESASATSSAAVTVGTWVNHVLFLAYRQHLSARVDENSSEGELEYWITRRIVVEGVAGDRGVAGVDLLWRKRY